MNVRPRTAAPAATGTRKLKGFLDGPSLVTLLSNTLALPCASEGTIHCVFIPLPSVRLLELYCNLTARARPVLVLPPQPTLGLFLFSALLDDPS